MSEMLEIVKIIAWTLFALTIFFIFVTLLAKYYFSYRKKQDIKKSDYIRDTFNLHLIEKKLLQPEYIKKLKKYIPQILVILDEFEQTHKDEAYLNTFKAQLSESILKPCARKWAFFYQWIKRFYATQCYQYGFNKEDRKSISTLLKDKTLLVSINMASIVVKKIDAFLINEMISTFSKGRRLQQLSFAEILTHDHPDISNILKERLEKENEKETDLYVKIFCYRLLSKMPKSDIILIALKDIEADSKDLKISVLDYLIHNKAQVTDEIIFKLVKDPDWEVRASVARVLGEIPGNKSLEQLRFLMRDEAWWVRINAANSLSKQGEKGFTLLEKLNPSEDKFAYEAAQNILRARQEKDD